MKWIRLIIDIIMRVLKIRREQKVEDERREEAERQAAEDDANRASDEIAEEAANVPKPEIDPDEDPFARYNRSGPRK